MNRMLHAHRSRHPSRAFTLVELIVAIVILGILAGLSVARLASVVDRSHDESARITLAAVARQAEVMAALDGAALEVGYFPDVVHELSGSPGAAELVTAAASESGWTPLVGSGQKVTALGQVHLDADADTGEIGMAIGSRSGRCVQGLARPTAPTATWITDHGFTDADSCQAPGSDQLDGADPLPDADLGARLSGATAQVTASWDTWIGADRYELSVADVTGDGDTIPAAPVTVTVAAADCTTAECTTDVAGLGTGRRYEATVSAVRDSPYNVAGYTRPSAWTLPGTTPVTAQATASGSVRLTWDAVGSAISYGVYAAGRGLLYSGPGLAFTDPLTDTGPRTYHVVVTNATGDGPAGPPTTIDVQRTPLVALAGVEQVDLSWGSQSWAASYTLERATSATGVRTTVYTGTALEFIDTGVTPGTEYFYFVHGTDAGGTNGPDNGPVSATPKPPVPAAPAVTATGSGTAVDISWTSPQWTVDYEVQWRNCTPGSETNWAALVTTATAAHTHGGLPASSCYRYQVRARNATGSSPWGVSPDAHTRPAQPTFTSVAGSGNRIDLTWTNGRYTTTNVFQRRVCGTSAWSTVARFSARSSWTNGGLADGTCYQYRVRGENAAGNGAWSAQGSSTTAPARPTATSATVLFNNGSNMQNPDVNNAKMRLYWTDEAASAYHEVRLYRRRQGASSWTYVTGPQRLSGTDTGHQWANYQFFWQYRMQVRACNDAGCSSWRSADRAAYTSRFPVRWSNGKLVDKVHGGQAHYGPYSQPAWPYNGSSCSEWNADVYGGSNDYYKMPDGTEVCYNAGNGGNRSGNWYYYSETTLPINKYGGGSWPSP